jgi:cytoskeletal protein CcmA (bactofilin family)
MPSTPVVAPVLEAATLTRGLTIVGEISSAGSIIVECVVDGPIWCEDGEVVVGASAQVRGDIVARDVTVEGRVEGQIIATEVVEVRSGAIFSGRIISKRFILEAGATVHARIEPQHLDTAIRVARFQQQKRNAAE